MNEIEIIVWSIWLDELGWNVEKVSMECLMFITAVQAKEYVNDESEMGIYKKEMDANYKKMTMSYEEWKKDHKVAISVIDINKRFRAFNPVILCTL